MSRHLLNDDDLMQSEVVANATMNRGRGLAGVNSYSRELRFDLLGYLHNVLDQEQGVAWLDVCCGTGKALIEAAQSLQLRNRQARWTICGVDLIDMFVPLSPPASGVSLRACSLHAFQPDTTFGLITCVHGLHYLGDKLGEIARMISWLEPAGRLLANFDADSIRDENGRSLASAVSKLFQNKNLAYNGRTKVVSCNGPVELTIPWVYLGADASAGGNYTGQPAVASYYRVA